MESEEGISYALEREKIELEREKLALERERLHSQQELRRQQAETGMLQGRLPKVSVALVISFVVVAFLSGIYLGSFIETSRLQRSREVRREVFLRSVASGSVLTNAPFASTATDDALPDGVPMRQAGNVILIME